MFPRVRFCCYYYFFFHVFSIGFRRLAAGYDARGNGRNVDRARARPDAVEQLYTIESYGRFAF